MSDLDDVWPDLLDGEYELRVTARARADLRANGFPASDLDAIAASSPWGDLVTTFAQLRSREPHGT